MLSSAEVDAALPLRLADAQAAQAQHQSERAARIAAGGVDDFGSYALADEGGNPLGGARARPGSRPRRLPVPGELTAGLP